MELVVLKVGEDGLNRSLNVGLNGCRRYVGHSVMSYNLLVIGRELLVRYEMGN